MVATMAVLTVGLSYPKHTWYLPFPIARMESTVIFHVPSVGNPVPLILPVIATLTEPVTDCRRPMVMRGGAGVGGAAVVVVGAAVVVVGAAVVVVDVPLDEGLGAAVDVDGAAVVEPIRTEPVRFSRARIS